MSSGGKCRSLMTDLKSEEAASTRQFVLAKVVVLCSCSEMSQGGGEARGER